MQILIACKSLLSDRRNNITNGWDCKEKLINNVDLLLSYQLIDTQIILILKTDFLKNHFKF